MQFEVEIHKHRIKELTEHKEQLEASVEHYMEQQSLFKLMKFDLEKYKKVYEMSREYETIYSPFTPQSQFKPEELVNLQKKNEIIDLKKVMEETNLSVEKVNKELAELKKANT